MNGVEIFCVSLLISLFAGMAASIFLTGTKDYSDHDEP